MAYLAHVNVAQKTEQSMVEHLHGTARRASGFAHAFHCADAGYLCGILHDIGKYSLKFQRRIRGSYETVDHSTAGAQVAFFELRNVPAAFSIAGHHGGLPDGGNPKLSVADDGTFFGKMRRKVGENIEEYSPYKSEIAFSQIQIPSQFTTDARTAFFFTRMLYSCLVDADFLDTEAFMSDHCVQRGRADTLQRLSHKLDRFVSRWWGSEKPINQKRCEILRALLETRSKNRLFSLTVPTGGGKTVGSMAFALRHALRNHLRRVIYVIPYTSIIEQTQQVFENIFGEKNVVAHYATLDYSTDENKSLADKRYLAAENYDAPIILTTAVQFFESLYANRSSRCRKLHNIANSVIIFDEAQMLPVPYLSPCIEAIAQLVENYGCSAVLCTATQPSIGRLFEQQFSHPHTIQELCPDVSDMYAFFQRVRYEKLGKLSDEELCAGLNAQKQVLCIVNSRKQAQKLYAMLHQEGSYHLSTTMYPAHRRSVLAEIRNRLNKNEPCRVISTSLVEAGVDVDFPMVYRALAGLDSIIQAGGRCNREGKREAGKSVVYIFETEQKSPQMLLQNIAATQKILREFSDISSPEAVRAYFEFLYYQIKHESELDKERILSEIDTGTMPFATVAEKFRIIKNTECTVYIPEGKGAGFAEALKEFGPSRSLMRKLGQYAVGVYVQHFNDLIGTNAAQKVGENAAVLKDLSLYSKNTGLSFHVNAGQEHII
ncbi:MAG: CRISPR-associated helicase Cas3' [Christensenellales bacterium]|jgi:CRISPR-associated endonuclease/helicase Cas3